MNTIDLNFDITDLEGNILDNAGKIVARALVSGAKGDPIKLYDIAQRLYKLENLLVDDSDKKMLYDFIKEHQEISILVKAPIMRAIESNG